MGIHRWSDLPVVRLLHASLWRYRTPRLSTMPPQSTTTQREAPEPSSTVEKNFCMLLRQLAAYLYLGPRGTREVSRLGVAWCVTPHGVHSGVRRKHTGAIREVLEETWVDTEFVDVVAFRHARKVAIQKSELFFVCMLGPLSSAIKIDETNIQLAKLHHHLQNYT